MPATVRPTVHPTVLVTDVRGKLRVVMACAEASRRGIVPDMSLAQAKALAADLVHAPWDTEALSHAALEVTTALLEASPRVAWGCGAVGPWGGRNEGVWWVDAAGLGEEKRLAQHLLRIAKKVDKGPVHVGIADSAVAAYAATFRHPTVRPSDRLTTLVPSGRDRAFLAPYPIRLLELDDDLAGAFLALGLRTLGQVAALDGDEVEARFGPDGLAAHRLARGIDARGPSIPRDDTLPVAECELGGAVATAEPLLFVFRGALSSLGTALRNKGLAAREITITLALDDGSSAARAVRPARPSSHEGVLFDHCRAALEDWSLPEPVVAVRIAATLTIPAAGEQGNLLVSRWADPAALEAAFERIRGREGGDAVMVPAGRDGHLPRDAGEWTAESKDRGIGGSKRRDSSKVISVFRSPGLSIPRPSALRLLPAPAPIRVRLGRSGLESFRQDDLWYDINAWSGPERLAPSWWTTADPARDYFIARTATGELWLLYRARSAWFIEGWWD